jgi:hypothetical protein
MIEGQARFDQPPSRFKCISFPRTYLWSSWFEGSRALRVLSVVGPSAGMLWTPAMLRTVRV